MTDAVKIAYIVAISGAVPTFIGLINRWTLARVEKTGHETKQLVDGTLAIQYQVNATSARTLANLTRDPAHILLADAAELKLRDHLATLASLGLRKDEPAP